MASPDCQVALNQAILYGDQGQAELYILVNKSEPGLFGNPHYHSNDRFQP